MSLLLHVGLAVVKLAQPGAREHLIEVGSAVHLLGEHASDQLLKLAAQHFVHRKYKSGVPDLVNGLKRLLSTD